MELFEKNREIRSDTLSVFHYDETHCAELIGYKLFVGIDKRSEKLEFIVQMCFVSPFGINFRIIFHKRLCLYRLRIINDTQHKNLKSIENWMGTD